MKEGEQKRPESPDGPWSFAREARRHEWPPELATHAVELKGLVRGNGLNPEAPVGIRHSFHGFEQAVPDRPKPLQASLEPLLQHVHFDAGKQSTISIHDDP